MENYLILYRQEHVQVFHAALEEYLSESVNVIIFPQNCNVKNPAKFYFISTTNVWERMTYFKLAKRHPVTSFYFFQHGHLEANSRTVSFSGKWKKSLITLKTLVLNLKHLRQVFINETQLFSTVYILDNKYLDILTESYNLRFTNVIVDNWLLFKADHTKHKDILFIHENFISAGMSMLSRSAEMKEFEDLFEEFRKLGLRLDICVHPMDRTCKEYPRLKGYINIEERVERIIGKYKVLISVSSSSILAANQMSIKTFIYNFYGIDLPEVKNAFTDRKELLREVEMYFRNDANL